MMTLFHYNTQIIPLENVDDEFYIFLAKSGGYKDKFRIFVWNHYGKKAREFP